MSVRLLTSLLPAAEQSEDPMPPILSGAAATGGAPAPRPYGEHGLRAAGGSEGDPGGFSPSG
jgi:hypothetical protein